jgi:Mrp family chromosome partitioning ATPase
MSRIDEAMRRAAGAGAVEPEPEQTVEDLQPEESSDAKALAREPYPAEVPERRERPAQSQNRDRAQGSYDTAGQAEPAAPESTLFERLDARLTEKIVVDHNMSPASREQYRRLAAVLHDAHNTSGLRLIMVASAVAGEGKTLTASNLALTFSESYQKRVLLIDADLRRPSLHTVFRLGPGPGRRPALDRRNQNARPAGVAAARGAAGRPPQLRPDGRAHLRAHAAAARRGQAVVRLGHSRHSSRDAAA